MAASITFKESLEKLGKSTSAGIGIAFDNISTSIWKAATESERSLNIIKKGTGATSTILGDLMTSYKKVGSEVPDEMNAVATVIAAIHKKTGATGTSLEEMSGKILRLGSLTGTSTSIMSTSMTSAMKDWDLGADQGGAMFDKLYFLSQKTGMGVNVLADKMVKFGDPMRRLGYDFDTSAAMIGQWTDKGLDADMVLASFSTALGKMSSQDIPDPGKGLESSIQKIKEASTMAEASGLAMKVFGEASGPTMASAIREGKLELGNLLNEMKNSKGIIDNVSKDTETLGDKFTVLKKNTINSLSPLGDKLMELANKNFPLLTKAIESLSACFDNMSPYINKFLDGLGENIPGVIDGIIESINFLKSHLEILGPVVGVVAIVFGTALTASLWSVAVAEWAAISPLLPFIAAVVGLGAQIALLGYMWKTNMFGLRDTASNVLGFVTGIFNKYSNYMSSIMPYILQIVAVVWPMIKTLIVTDCMVIWGIIKLVFTHAYNMISWFLTALFNIMGIIWNYSTGMFKVFLQLLTLDFSGALQTWLDTFKNVGMGIAQFVTDFISVYISAFSLGVDIITNNLRTFLDTVIFVFTTIGGLVGLIFDIFTSFLTVIWQLLTGNGDEAKLTVQRTFEEIVDFLNGILNGVTTIGSNFVEGIITGIVNAFPNLSNTIVSIGQAMRDGIRSFLGIKSPSKVMMEVGYWTTEGLVSGLENGENSVIGSSEKIAEAVVNPFENGISHYGFNSDQTIDLTYDTAKIPASSPAIPPAAYYNSPTAFNNAANTEINPVINITLNGDSNESTAKDIAEKVKLAIQEVFESASRRQGIAGG
ncbi:Phage-related minor tail protein [Paenibacillus sp. 1_12]|uniref:phage tail tape measure protein n=1 Tax=Paenibacillus sp. 1_12 TaxID=1566278 RepID=UPI0008EA404A|nr:phage tail tape measure protein [Paenibacillus sp. 1_12]SFL09704.1 Phage-related minor tail protein [Paenibacillus sp. 1_12]